MCGISGTINYKKIELDVNLIKKALYHRGPDEQNHCEFNNTLLVHTRLSIQDILHGQQPFSYEEFTIVFNGEIYNHIELREEYLAGFNFETLSDTETLLILFSKYKEKMLNLLDGMFAFAILDKKNHTTFLARDRAGKKPLYIYKDNNKIMFSSELNAIKAINSNLKINENSVNAYLRTGIYFKENTIYKNVQQLEAGHYCIIDTNSLKVRKERYFNILDYYSKPVERTFEESLSEVDSLLHKSVKSRLESSDIEVGAFLSGGIDSSLIVAIASEYKKDLKTFTVSFEGGYDESSLAKQTAKKYNTKHNELPVSLNLKEDIEKILLNYGQPFMDSSAIPSYYVSQEAKKHVSVILNGDGADELFGGYRRYVPMQNNWLEIAKKISFLLKVIPKPHNKQSKYNYIYRLLSMASKDGLDFYLSATSNIYEDIYKFENNDVLSDMDNFIKSTSLNGLSKMLYLDFNILLYSNLLTKMDIATMVHSLEGRSPFLSKYMLEFAPTISNDYKINGKTTKYILRELSKEYLPQDIVTQPKRGFEVPIKKWVENDLRDNIFDNISSDCYAENFIDRKFINNVLNKKINISDERRSRILWNMYTLEVWYKNR